MRIHIAADHAGFHTKQSVIAHLQANGHEVTDHGAYRFDELDDYPPMCIAAAQATVDDPGSLGIVLGGSGNGEQIAANKVVGARAILAWNIATAKLGREHNNANVLSIGARQHSLDEVFAMVDAFVAEPFSDAERHVRRIDLLSEYEAKRG